MGITYEVDSNLVRGLDYYNKTGFEFVSNEIGAQSATITSGGRYDRLVEFFRWKIQLLVLDLPLVLKDFRTCKNACFVKKM